jgi:hypothetical protein
MYSGAISKVKERTKHAEEIEKRLKQEVRLAAYENTMREQGIRRKAYSRREYRPFRDRRGHPQAARGIRLLQAVRRCMRPGFHSGAESRVTSGLL